MTPWFHEFMGSYYSDGGGLGDRASLLEGFGIKPRKFQGALEDLCWVSPWVSRAVCPTAETARTAERHTLSDSRYFMVFFSCVFDIHHPQPHRRPDLCASRHIKSLTVLDMAL